MTLPPHLVRGEDYQDLREQLTLTLGAATSSTAAAFALQHRTQRDGETIHAFARDIGVIAHQAFPDSRQTDQRQAVTASCTGLSDVNLPHLVLQHSAFQDPH